MKKMKKIYVRKFFNVTFDYLICSEITMAFSKWRFYFLILFLGYTDIYNGMCILSVQKVYHYTKADGMKLVINN